MNDTLRTKLQRHYQDAELPAERVAALTALARRADPARGRVARLVAVVATAAALALLVVAVEPAPPPSVAAEIAANHEKDLAPELAVDTYDVRAEMTRLDFDPIRPARLDGHELVGARYCSLQDHVAAQFRLTDAAGRTCTLYQVRDAAAFHGVEDCELAVRGLRISLWREGGLLLGLAAPR